MNDESRKYGSIALDASCIVIMKARNFLFSSISFKLHLS